MPPVRRKKRVETQQTLDLGQRLCNALKFGDRMRMYKSLKDHLHRAVDRSFDLCIPAADQPGNMKRYMTAITESFPGYFKNQPERSTALEEYITSYLDDNRNILPPGDVIKVRRPSQSRSRRNRQTKNVPSVIFVLDPAPIEPPPAPPMDMDPPDEDADDDDDDDDDDDTPAREVEDMGDAPGPVPEIENISDRGRGSSLVPELSPPPSSPPSMDSESEDLDQQLLDPIDYFLETCMPSMGHCAAALKIMGATTHEDLVGMARWSEERLRAALNRHNIPQKPLDEEALVIGFSALLG